MRWWRTSNGNRPGRFRRADAEAAIELPEVRRIIADGSTRARIPSKSTWAGVASLVLPMKEEQLTFKHWKCSLG